jgi:hypothetical protein
VNANAPGGATPTWTTWRDALRVVAYRLHLSKTIRIALLVGTTLFCINQLNVVLEHKADWVVWLKVSLTYLVPFCVSDAGILVGTRGAPRPGSHGHDPAS